MAHVPTPNTVRACLRYNQSGQRTCNVFHIDVGEEPTEAILQSVASNLKGWWDAHLQQATENHTSLEAVEVVDVSGDDEEGIIYTTGLPLAGLDGTGALPNNATVCISCSGGLTGRSRRGRKYFAGLPQGAIEGNGNELTSAFQTALKTAFENLIVTMTTAGFEWVINSTISGGVPRTEGINTPVTNISVDDTLDSMRRRLPGRGT